MSTQNFECPAQVSDDKQGAWVYVPVVQIRDSGATFKTGNPGAMCTAQVADFPGIGVVNLGFTVRLKQPKGSSKAAAADPVQIAAQVIAMLQAQGIPLAALVPGAAAGQPVTVPPGTTGQDLSAGKAAAQALVSGLPGLTVPAAPASVPTVNGGGDTATLAQGPEAPAAAAGEQETGDQADQQETGDQAGELATADAQ